MRTKKILFVIPLLFSVWMVSCGKEADTVADDIIITSISPSHGPSNTVDTIMGKNFDKLPAVDSIAINGKKLNLISRSADKIIISIPERTGSGNVEVWYQGKYISGPLFTYDSTLFVTTIAGSTETGAVDGKGTDARFYNLMGIAVDGKGNIYVTDWGNTIRKITPDGTVSTLAGPLTGSQGGFHDGKGADAMFLAPVGITLAPDGFLYVGDYENYKIRKVSLDGEVTTLSGRSLDNRPVGELIDGDISTASFNAPFGITADKDKNLYVADKYNNRIRKISSDGKVSSLGKSGYFTSGDQDGPVAEASFREPVGIVVDHAGNLYVDDAGNVMVRKISNNGMVTTLFGPDEPELSIYTDVFRIGGMAIDKDDNLLFSNFSQILKRTPAGVVTRFLMASRGYKDGPVPYAEFKDIRALTIDDSGTIYVADEYRVRKIQWR